MKRYNPKEIESKWQKIWDDEKSFEVKADDTKPKSYVTAMFPYPSGAGLHVGHVRNYSITDAIARFERAQGKNVLSAMGWDAFGLPAENFAIKTGVPPAESTKQNIVNFKNQLKKLGVSYDWSRELNTTDPEYYRWTQWLFLKFFEKGLAYQKESLQWWCPECKTVLANEQVINGGYCWRHEETLAEKKWLKQWFLKITDYADELLDAIDDLAWPEKIKTMQRNWIGRSKGAEVEFSTNDGYLNVFTTRPDTLFGATFLVLAPEHPMVDKLTTKDSSSQVQEYVKESVKKSDIDRMSESREKTGVFTGSYAKNPINGEDVPIWVADYVLMGYGTGAIMAVPAHDQRDHDFAAKFGIDIKEVVAKPSEVEGCYSGEGAMLNSGKYDGLSSAEAREKIVADLENNSSAKEKVNYRMRDWLISRQRYWGTPIPIIHCEKDGAVAVPEDQLPVVLPDVEKYEPKGDGKGVLAHVPEWYNVDCPKCGGPAVRETDTLDGYVCSSWYLFRYADAKNTEQPWDTSKVDYWAPVDFYCGGDHAVAHLLYVRFWTKFLRDIKLLHFDEPVKNLVYNGYINAHDGFKMSKSRGNVVDPLELINQGYGADSLRVYELFIGPYEQDASWDPKGIAGTYRFLNRSWTLVQEFSEADFVEGDASEVTKSAHKAIKKVTEDLSRHSFNTAIAALMEFVNEMYKLKADGFKDKGAWQFALTTLAQLVQPFAPHISEEIWQQLGHEGSVSDGGWPEWNKTYLITDTITVVVQVNGKLRAKLDLPADVNEADAIEAAKQSENVITYLKSDPKKTIYIAGKLINFVV